MKYKIQFYEELSSTNEFGIKNLAEINDKTVLLAKTQTNGYGRFDRNWVSDNPENIYASFILKPDIKLGENSVISNLTQYLSVILCKTLEKYGLKPAIKWPNDVLVNNKKIAGILAQTSIKGNSAAGVVLGIGINVNMPENELSQINQPATSISNELSHTVSKEEFAKELFDNFFNEYETFMEKGFDYIKSDYCKRCSFLSKEIIVKDRENTIEGIAESINDNGTLKIKLKNENKYETLQIGDLTCLNY